MSIPLKRPVYGIGWAAFIALFSGVSGMFRWSENAALRGLQHVAVYFDLPISAVSLILPIKGAWYFFVPANYDRGIAPEGFAILGNQLIIGIPTYLAIFWLVAWLMKLVSRHRYPETAHVA